MEVEEEVEQMEKKKEKKEQHYSSSGGELPSVEVERTILINGMTTERIKFKAKGMTSQEAITNLASTMDVFIAFEQPQQLEEKEEIKKG